jgi:hypothetical protein
MSRFKPIGAQNIPPLLLLNQLRCGLQHISRQKHGRQGPTRFDFVQKPAMPAVETANNLSRLGTGIGRAQILL